MAINEYGDLRLARISSRCGIIYLTKHTEKTSLLDGYEPDEITPAMLEAGVERYLTLMGEVEASYAVSEIFAAMVARQKAGPFRF